MALISSMGLGPRSGQRNAAPPSMSRVNSLCSPRRAIISAITHWAQQEASVELALCRQRWTTQLSGRQTRIRTAPQRVSSISCFRRRALAKFPTRNSRRSTSKVVAIVGDSLRSRGCVGLRRADCLSNRLSARLSGHSLRISGSTFRARHARNNVYGLCKPD